MIRPNCRSVFRGLTAAAFAAVGTLHFLHADVFARIVPPIFPKPVMLVYLSGICEIAGGLGLLIPPLRRPAAWGLLALLMVVFPANIYMAIDPTRFSDLHLPLWLIWLRLPMQGLFAWDVWWVGLGNGRR